MLNDIFEKRKKSIIVPCTAAFSGGAVPHWPLMQRRNEEKEVSCKSRVGMGCGSIVCPHA